MREVIGVTAAACGAEIAEHMERRAAEHTGAAEHTAVGIERPMLLAPTL
jgi:hypothetical protein